MNIEVKILSLFMRKESEIIKERFAENTIKLFRRRQEKRGTL